MIGVSEKSTQVKNPPTLGMCHRAANNDRCHQSAVGSQEDNTLEHTLPHYPPLAALFIFYMAKTTNFDLHT